MLDAHSFSAQNQLAFLGYKLFIFFFIENKLLDLNRKKCVTWRSIRNSVKQILLWLQETLSSDWLIAYSCIHLCLSRILWTAPGRGRLVPRHSSAGVPAASPSPPPFPLSRHSYPLPSPLLLCVIHCCVAEASRIRACPRNGRLSVTRCR